MANSSLSTPRNFPTQGFDIIDRSETVEEQSLPNYDPKLFYPVRLGEVLNNRYQIVGKLGYGTSSTVWLGRDFREQRYKVLKIFTTTSPVIEEIKVYDHLNALHSDHAGQSCIRKLFDHFEVNGPDGTHMCLVHQPLGMNLHQLRKLFPDRALNNVLLKTTLRNILAALDFLHSEAQVIHTDLQPNNIMLGIKDDKILSQFEEAEFESPIPRKVEAQRTIYLSRHLAMSYGTPVLCDFGEARIGTENHAEDIMPDVYRAPEVILQIPWNYKVDIWNVGVLTWDLFEGQQLFQARDAQGRLDDAQHLAEMQAILGPTPLDFVQRGEKHTLFWDENGDWKSDISVPTYNLETLEEKLEGDDQGRFLQFMRRMLCWSPDDRATAKELLFDPWLMEGLFK
ncbi:kinase-like protein [Aspergillus pseudotamarii]|uniref:Kinase-like protein n=1 Tax=Aspergillus pseudotamarii TaxID=132259 RepID=A0A5N6T219_ASPPS|nr:kinase-like protein [Aspergillus pseudotamarii]KAE8140333.1 kinase-like protein [Aspergillus pseudotamarii]